MTPEQLQSALTLERQKREAVEGELADLHRNYDALNIVVEYWKKESAILTVNLDATRAVVNANWNIAKSEREAALKELERLSGITAST